MSCEKGKQNYKESSDEEPLTQETNKSNYSLGDFDKAVLISEFGDVEEDMEESKSDSGISTIALHDRPTLLVR